jgi:hypothetical protein
VVINSEAHPEPLGVLLMSVLDQVRSNPDAAFEIYDFYVDASRSSVVSDGRVQTGGPCTILEECNRTLVTLKVGNLPGRDYYFPWKPSGVGIVEVPMAAPDGTIVVTGGMNGCSVEVIQRGSTLVFYHDADGCQMRNTVPVDGSPIFRRDYKEYAPHDIGYKTMDALKATRAYLYQFVFVKTGQIWKAFVSGVMLDGSQRGRVTGSFRDAPSKMMGSFPKLKTE